MEVTIFGAAGPTGGWACREALRAGHHVCAVSRRSDPITSQTGARLRQVHADAVSGVGVREAVTGADAVLSALGVAYTRHHVSAYSSGTRRIIDALRAVGNGNRLIVVSSGLTYPPPRGAGLVPDRIVFPLLRNIIGRTLYADMRRMEEMLRETEDIAWTIMRPGQLFDSDAVSAYQLNADHPSRRYTARADLAAAMVDELNDETAHPHQAMAPTTAR